MLYRLLNSIILVLLSVFSIFHTGLRKFLRVRLNQDFSFLEGEETIWVHCSSMGEVNLSYSLVKKFLEERTEHILISVFTDTGYENAKNKYNGLDRVNVIYFPLDKYSALKKIKKEINLKLLVIVETEIWPNLLNICKKSSIMLINGRISDRSYPKYKKIRCFIKKRLRQIDMLLMQSHEDAEKIIALGAYKENVEIVGNLKFVTDFVKYSEEEKSLLKNKIRAEDKKIIVLGSTRELEEEQILTGIDRSKKYLFVIIPRHLNRIPTVEKLLKDKGITYKKYSELEELDESVDVILVDAMGVQRLFYSISDAVFVGGTLVNVGGHSLLEPLFYGKTPIYGKYIQNVKDIAKELKLRGLGYQIEDANDFQIEVENILKKGPLDEKINQLFEENKNVLKKTLEKVDVLI